MTGKLFIVATPIGNLKDITFRAIETLKAVALIACEDTRHTKKLLSHYGISTPTTSYFEYNKIQKGGHLLKLLKEGRDIALVSDSGTPGISDPGFNIVRLAIENSILITVIPGPSAIIAGIVLSGMPTDSFVFEGFLAQRPGKRRNELKALNQEKRTIVIYESPHRILKTLKDILDIMGDRDISVMRELTKVFEETLRLKVSESIEHFTKNSPRGEFIIVIKGKTWRS
ncbi:MAG: 16S rRNA (cytidine(1402)-2'-O)-methyltransferase [Candidatus Omnitrophica bacterium CG12_big_fil_rev_8_21_14_0_65_42_8]|nr:MAG: 16S rRNA (cytidine(1402)-2'-O)-methyltransferase [Candidatus Omnitrophica bacterium CG12_big_fil_rev_8_21_14_0_65_42_8]